MCVEVRKNSLVHCILRFIISWGYRSVTDSRNHTFIADYARFLCGSDGPARLAERDRAEGQRQTAGRPRHRPRLRAHAQGAVARAADRLRGKIIDLIFNCEI